MIPVLVMNDTRVDCHHGCDAVMATIGRMLAAHGMEATEYWPAHQEWEGSEAFETALSSARLVVVNGEGTIHHDRPAGRNLLRIGARARVAGVPSALINVGWEANGSAFLSMLNDFDLVSARDTRSAEAMADGGCGVRVVPDLSLCSPVPASAATRAGIGVTDNVDRLKALALDHCRRGLGADGKCVSIIYPDGDHFARYLRSGLSLREDLLSPMRLMRLVAMRRAQWQTAQGPGLAKFLEDLAGLDLLVSGRFHACTLALVAATPFVAQASNTGKIAAMVADVGLEAWRAEPQLDADALREIAAQGWSDAENAARAEYLERARHSADQLFDDLAALV